MSYENKDWLYNGQPIIPPTKTEQPKTAENKNTPDVASVRVAQKEFMKKYIVADGTDMTKHEFETLAAHARAAKENAKETEKGALEDLAKTVEALWKNRGK